MKKIVLLTIITIPLTLYFLNQGEDIKPEIENDLLAPETKNKVLTHRETVIKKAIGKKLADNNSFKKLISNDKKTELKKEDVIKDKEFVRKTFKKLYDCHQDGCGEGPDHDGYFNAGKTVAIQSINQILELSLLDESNSDSKWPKQEELLGLLSVENKKTRSLSLAHLLKKSVSDPLAKEALYDTVKGLKDNGFVDAVTGIAKYDGYVDSNEFVDLISAGFIATSNHGVIESIYELNTKMQLDEQQFQKVSLGLCKRIQDINAKSIVTGMNKWAENSGHSTKIEDVCNQ